MSDYEKGNAETAQNPETKAQAWDRVETGRDWRRKCRAERRSHPYHGLFAGLTLILLGALFLFNQAGWVTGDSWWKYLLIGLGGISIINGLLNYFSQRYRWFSFGKFLAGFILITLGVIFLLGAGQWWPLVIVVVGLALIFRSFWRWQYRRDTAQD
jgi:hypothetical protein